MGPRENENMAKKPHYHLNEATNYRTEKDFYYLEFKYLYQTFKYLIKG